jgi:ABC-2 type transport system permease protein
VNAVTLSIAPGELFGLVGPNGAGKTTLIKMLNTLILPSSGSASVYGVDLGDVRRLKETVGLVTSDERSFFWRLTGEQNLAFFAALHQVPREGIDHRIREVMCLMGLPLDTGKPFQAYSTGMRQRLSIARALLPNPKVLFLDEPTRGLDPDSSRHLQDLIRDRLSRLEGVTVFMASHNLEEVEKVCDRVAIMRQGRIVACGTLAELGDAITPQVGYEFSVQGLPDGEILAAELTWLPNFEVVTLGKDSHLLRFHALPEEGVLDRVFTAIKAQGGLLQQVDRNQASLESIFSRVAQREELLAPPQDPPPLETKKHPPVSSTDVRIQEKGSPFRDFLRVVPAFLRRDWQLEFSYRLAFFLQFFEILFSVAAFYFIARLIGPAANPYLQAYGGDYFSFVLIGIAFTGYFGVGLSSFSSSLRQAQTTGTLEAMLSTPTSFSAIIVSSTLWSYLMTTLRVGVYLLIGTLFLGVDLNTGNLGAALLILVLTVISFSSLGILAASFIMVLKRGNPVTWLFGTFSSLLGGVYYPIDVMPAWLQVFSYLLPVTYALHGMRLALLQGAGFDALATDIAVLLLFCLVLLPLGLFAFRFAVNKARADGSLTHY